MSGLTDHLATVAGWCVAAAFTAALPVSFVVAFYGVVLAVSR